MNSQKNIGELANGTAGATDPFVELSVTSTDPGSTAAMIPADGQELKSTVILGPEGQAPAKLRGTQPETSAAWPIIQGYTILKELGRGGMGVVYLAKQHGLDRLVAIKMLLPNALADAEQVRRFQTEMRVVAAFNHPNIVSIYEVGEQDGVPFCSLEYVPGIDLAGRIDRVPQPPREAASLMEKISRAIHVTHQHNIVHRDLKPRNILLACNIDQRHGGQFAEVPLTDLTPKITDFGLAKRLDLDMQQLEQTRSGTIMGTLSYMSFEQARGLVSEIGPLSDVYSLGAILYELLTGSPPFVGSGLAEILQQVIYAEPVPPMRLVPKVPRDLETICLKCLQKDRTKRYPSAEELADDLQRFLAGEPILARPVSAVEQLWRWCRRNPKLAAATGISIVLLIMISVVSVSWAISISKKNLTIEKEKQTAVEAQKIANEKTKTATQQATENLVTIQLMIKDINEQLSELPRTQRLRERILKLAEIRIATVARAVDKSTSKEATDLASLSALGNLYAQIGASDKAFDYLSRALTVARERVVVRDRADSSRMNVALVLLDLGRVCQELRRDMQLSLAYYEEAAQVRQEVLDEPRPGDGNAADPRLVKTFLAEDRIRVATTIFRLGNPAGALPHYEASLSLRSELAKITNNPQIRQDLLRSRLGIAEMKFRLDDATTVRQDYLDAIAEREKLLANAAEGDRMAFAHELARTFCGLGDVCLFMGDLAAAKTYYEQCRDRMQQLVDMDDQLVNYQRDLGLVWYRLGCHSLRSGDQAAAAKWFDECLHVRQSLADKDPANDRRQMELMLALAHCQPARAAEIAERYRTGQSPDNELLIDVARSFAQCSAGAAGNPSLQKEYAEKAVAALSAAFDNQYCDFVYVRSEPDLDPLRHLADYKMLVDKWTSDLVDPR